MKQGTTPHFEFVLPFDTSTINSVRVYFAQDDRLIVTKTEADCTFNENEISVRLTQEDTFLFEDDKYVQIQLRVCTGSGEAMLSDTFRVFIGQCFGDEVLS